MLGGAVRKRLPKLECGHIVFRVVLNCVVWTIVECGKEITFRRAEIKVLPFILCRKRSKQVRASQIRMHNLRLKCPIT